MVMSLLWGIFILNPKITPRYFEIVDTDQQGMPMTITGIYDKSFQISQSTLNRQYIVPKEIADRKHEPQQFPHYIKPAAQEPMGEDRQQLLSWLLNI